MLSIRGSKFFDHACGRGGGGAIDLVMHARRCGFREALAFLDDQTSSLPPAATAPPPQPQPLLPDPVARHWPDVRVFLARVRALDPALLAQCHPPAAVLLVESAIDALSAILLPAPNLPADCLVVSTAGTACRLPQWLTHFSHAELLCGFDADPPGDQAARALSRRLPRLRRLRPNSAKDWNDLLRLRSPSYTRTPT